MIHFQNLVKLNCRLHFWKKSSSYRLNKSIPITTPITTSKMQNPPRLPINSGFQFFDVTSYFDTKKKRNDSY